MNLEKLISQIQSLDGILKQEANKAVNRLLTIRNWLIGYYIVEYEQKGEDRAKYGANILDMLSASLKIKGLSVTNLKLNRLFYIVYPHINHLIFIESRNFPSEIGQTLSDESKNNLMRIRQTLSDESKDTLKGVMETSSTLSYEAQLAERIISRLSFSHIVLLLPIEDTLKPTFYTVECIKGTWSVRELKRQINSLLFERSGISKKPEQLLQNLNEKPAKHLQVSFIKDIYTFEFLKMN